MFPDKDESWIDWGLLQIFLLVVTPYFYCIDFYEKKMWGVLKFIGTCVLAMVAYELLVIRKWHEIPYDYFFKKKRLGGLDIA